MGQQNRAAYFAVFCYYIIGIPLAFLFGLKFGWGVMGLQGGAAIAVLLQSIGYALIVSRCDWQQIADDTLLRINEEEKEVDERNKSEGINEWLLSEDHITFEENAI